MPKPAFCQASAKIIFQKKKHAHLDEGGHVFLLSSSDIGKIVPQPERKRPCLN